MKRCARCQAEKSESEFPIDRSKKSGHRPYCKQCACQISHNYRANNAEKVREKNIVQCRSYYWRNIDRSRAMARAASNAKGYDGRKDHNLRMRFGITLEQYQKMWDDQKGLCASCGHPETRTDRGRVSALAVDHNRKCCPSNKSCGKCLRGLLCFGCNTAIGVLKEDPKTFYAALNYLEMHSNQRQGA